MALYVPAGARTRRLVLIAAAAVVVGLVVGFLGGRASAPGLADEVHAVQGLAVDATTTLERIPIEYEQSVAGEGGESTDTITGAIERARSQLDDAFAAAIWLPDDASSGTDEAFDGLVGLVAEEAAPKEVEAAIEGVVGQIASVFGITATPAG